MLLGVGLAFVREHLDDSIKGKEDFERAVPGTAVLGLIPLVPDWKVRDEGRVVSITEPNSTAAEAYRILRTSIQFMGLDRTVRIIQVTSPNAAEGKTTTLSNLAVAFAASGLRTVVVDCDLRRPRLHAFFDVDQRHWVHLGAAGRGGADEGAAADPGTGAPAGSGVGAPSPEPL